MLTDNWRRTIDRAKTDRAWDQWDAVIKSEVADYAKRLNLSADWQFFKAQAWTESGAASPEWNAKVMQIGVPGDPGYATMRDHKEYADAIMSAQVAADLKRGRSINDPVFNIQVGMAYAYMELSQYDTVITDKAIKSHTVVAGDVGLEKIAHQCGTTVKNLRINNPNLGKILQIGQELKYQSAKIAPVSIAVNAAALKNSYNRGGDVNYADKITYCYNIIITLRR